MLFKTMLTLSRNPDEVANAYEAGSEIWADFLATTFKEFIEEELDIAVERWEKEESSDYLVSDLDVAVGDRLAKALSEKQEEIKRKVGLHLYEDVFSSVGFLHFYNKYRQNVEETDYLIRAFRRSDWDMSIQNKAEKLWEFIRYDDLYGDQGMISLIAETILMLSKDPHLVKDAYNAGTRMWSDIYKADYSPIYREEVNKMMDSDAHSYKPKIAERLAVILPAKEAALKEQCGEDLYAEVFAVIGVLYFYDAQDRFTGEAGARARRILEAFRLSNCSDTVKEKVEGLYKRARKG